MTISSAYGSFTSLDDQCETNSRQYNQYVNTANELCKFAKYDECLDYIDKAIMLKPSYIEAYYTKAHALFLQNKNEEAVIIYNKIITLDSSDAKTHAVKSYILSSMGKDKEAFDAIRTALELEPENGEYQFSYELFKKKVKDDGL